MSEQSRISELTELEKAQQEKTQQIKILSLDDDHVSKNDDVTENSSDENDENLNLIDNENIDENDSQLDTTTRSGRTVRLIEKMWQSKTQEAVPKRKKPAVQEVADMLLEHAMTVKKTDQQDEIINQILLSNSYLEAIQHSKYKVK